MRALSSKSVQDDIRNHGLYNACHVTTAWQTRCFFWSKAKSKVWLI